MTLHHCRDHARLQVIAKLLNIWGLVGVSRQLHVTARFPDGGMAASADGGGAGAPAGAPARGVGPGRGGADEDRLGAFDGDQKGQQRRVLAVALAVEPAYPADDSVVAHGTTAGQAEPLVESVSPGEREDEPRYGVMPERVHDLAGKLGVGQVEDRDHGGVAGLLVDVGAPYRLSAAGSPQLFAQLEPPDRRRALAVEPRVGQREPGAGVLVRQDP